MRILLVEDYVPLRESLEQALREEHFAVDSTGDGEEALWFARNNPYDAAILDLMLPKVDGLTILATLREEKVEYPVLILTARDGVGDRVRGLDFGADDYLVKPFAVSELLARLRALLRRSYRRRSGAIRAGHVIIDTVTQVVRADDEAVDLTAREYALLEYLASRPGEVVSRTDVWEHVYDFRSETQSNVVDVYVGRLRRKLDRPGRAGLIETVRGRGYRFGGET